jgi:hypothetical protein
MNEKLGRYPVFTHQNISGFHYYDFAAFCYDVYFEEIDQVKLAEGWVTFCDSAQMEETAYGYFGRCYTRKTTKDNKDYLEISFAHRGTVVDLNKIYTMAANVLSDVLLKASVEPLQITPAINFCKKALVKIADHFQNIIIYYPIHCGHSLGAIISDCVSQILGKSELSSGLTITFENPGSLNLIKKLVEEKRISENAVFEMNSYNSFVLQGDYNVINTALPKVSQPNMLYTDYTHFQKRTFYDFFIKYPDLSISVDADYANLFYTYEWSFFIHRIDYMYEYLNKYEKYEYLKTPHSALVKEPRINLSTDDLHVDYPGNWADGYKRYLTYWKRANYWEEYFELCWLNHPEIHKDFNNDKFRFYSDKQSELEKIVNGGAYSEKEDNKNISIVNISLFNTPLVKKEQHDFVLVDNENIEDKELNNIRQEDYNDRCSMM